MQVSNIICYPIKSCGGIQLNEAQLGRKGLLYDREWLIVKAENGGFVTARNYPKLLTTRLSFSKNNLWLVVEINGQEQKLYLPLDATKSPVVSNSEPEKSSLNEKTPNEIPIRVWKIHYTGDDVGDVAAEFFTNFLEFPVRIVRSSPVPPRKLKNEAPDVNLLVTPEDEVSYADQYPYLLASEKSLDNLNEKIQLEKPLPIARFRPNIIFKGENAFEEDKFKTVLIGKNKFSCVQNCARCKMTTVDQELGEYAGEEPLKTLKTFRKQKNIVGEGNGITFGIHLIEYASLSDEIRKITIGDKIEVLETREPQQFVD